MNISLSGAWTLSCFKPDQKEAFLTVPATVPGNVELDLYRAGIEPEPYFGENEYRFRKYEFCDWTFERVLFVPDGFAGEKTRLIFEGLNCFADVYVNGIPVGHAENALIPHVFDVTDALKPGEENRFIVKISSAIRRAMEYDYPVSLSGSEGSDESTRLRMPPHSFGWDILPRFPSAGMWRGVKLETVPKTEILQTYYATKSVSDRSAQVLYKYRFKTALSSPDGFSVRVYLNGEKVVDRETRFVSGEGTFTVENPRLWWPKGYGDANLYEVRTEIAYQGEVVASRKERIGLRVARVIHKMAPNDEGEFKIEVNGCPILAKGSNWVPMDALHSRDAERYERAVALFAEAGCNILRLWGGNTYEDHQLFDLCDENGILVWHDFALACAIYPQSPEFQSVIYDEAVTVIRKLRNHACILLWAGDNEVDEAYVWHGYAPESNRYNAISRETLPRAVRENDPMRVFLPSSPYIEGGIAREDIPEQHNWGPRAYFKDDYYRLSRAHFVSECGYHGCPAPETLKKFIPEDELWPMGGGSWTAHNSEYRLAYKRGYDRNELMANQVRIMFGKMPETLEEFSLLSQFTQAEAVKFFIERTRIRKWRRTGIIWWNMLDGWPQISDAVVDWYFTKKRAFQAIARVQTPVCVMLDEHEAWGHDVILGNDSRESAAVTYRLIDADTLETLLSGESLSPANENVSLGSVRILTGVARLLLIEWFVNGKRFVNHYLTGFPPYSAENGARWAKLIDEWGENHA